MHCILYYSDKSQKKNIVKTSLVTKPEYQIGLWSDPIGPKHTDWTKHSDLHYEMHIFEG